MRRVSGGLSRRAVQPHPTHRRGRGRTAQRHQGGTGGEALRSGHGGAQGQGRRDRIRHPPRFPARPMCRRTRSTGTPQLRIAINRDALARYGINVADVQEALRIAIGGDTAGQIFEGIRRFDIFLRFAPEFRSTPEQIGHLLMPSPERSQSAAGRTGDHRGDRRPAPDHARKQPALHHRAVQRARAGHRLLRGRRPEGDRAKGRSCRPAISSPGAGSSSCSRRPTSAWRSSCRSRS